MARSPRTLRIRALAKINLSLRVIGTHADGYHELRTVFQSLALHDTLTVVPSRGPLTLSCDDPSCPTDESNLVWQAAALLWRADGRRGKPGGAKLAIAKRIPMQAGLGGGSSNAAAALRVMSRLWRVQVEDAGLHAIACELGADVPYFLVGGTALGVGRGEVLYPLEERTPEVVVLVAPGFGVLTRDAYGWWDAAHPGRGLVVGKEQGNDLQPPVVEHHPEIGRIVNRLSALGARQAAMSGSGSVVFGLFADESAALDAAAAVAAPRRVVTVTRTVGRREYRKVANPY